MKKLNYSVKTYCYFLFFSFFLKKYSLRIKKCDKKNLNTLKKDFNISFNFSKIKKSNVLFRLLNLFYTKIPVGNHISSNYCYHKNILFTDIKLFFLLFFKSEFLKKKYFFFFKEIYINSTYVHFFFRNFLSKIIKKVIFFIIKK
nr:hypothetical protein CparaKRNrm3_p014 [Cryptomonas paramecium]